MKKVEFYHELTEAAFNVYSVSTFEFYIDADGTYYCSDMPGSEKYRIGNLEAVEEYLLSFAE
jgi:hypothetical protein